MSSELDIIDVAVPFNSEKAAKAGMPISGIITLILGGLVVITPLGKALNQAID